MEIQYESLDALLKVLSQSQEETLSYFDLSEEDLAKTYAPDKWTVRELLHHLADAETVLYERIRRGIARPGQVIWGFDQDAWADKLAYANRELTVDQAIYAAIRRGVMTLATTYYESAGDNQYVHNETGLRIVRQEFDKVAWHNEHHLKQIRQALA
ncbi:MAG: DinB family protein [Bacteroidota bacterium]